MMNEGVMKKQLQPLVTQSHFDHVLGLWETSWIWGLALGGFGFKWAFWSGLRVLVILGSWGGSRKCDRRLWYRMG